MKRGKKISSDNPLFFTKLLSHYLRSRYSGYLYTVAAIFSLVLVSSHSYAQQVDIQVADKVSVNEEEIYLKDIADIKGKDTELIKRLSNILVFSAPLPGRVYTLDDSRIIIKLRQEQIDNEKIKLTLPPKIFIARAAVTFSPEKIETIVRNYLNQNLKLRKEKVEIGIVGKICPVVLPEGEMGYEINVLGKKDLVGYSNLAITFYVDGEKVKDIHIRTDVRLFLDVVALKKDVLKGEGIDEDKVILIKKDISRSAKAKNFVLDLESIKGKRAKNFLRTGTLLRANMLEDINMVKAGDIVDIVIENKGVKITAKGQIVEDALVSELAWVKNLDSLKDIRARVINKNVVKIEL
ncbi:MAG: flagellar basal body P-ring formation chaperone FlgA [bacterium]